MAWGSGFFELMNGRTAKMGRKGNSGEYVKFSQDTQYPEIFGKLRVFLKESGHIRKNFQAIVGIGYQVDGDLFLLLPSVSHHYLGPGNMLQALGEGVVRV